MFGELIGLWCGIVWQAAGCPDPVNMVELGPGRGTLMADALRAAAGVPGFRPALRVHLVEVSPALRARQRETLAAALLDPGPAWHGGFETVPEGPLLLIANEFFDALPIHQFQRTEAGWCERLVDWDLGTGELRFVLSPPVPRLPVAGPPEVPPGGIVEVCPAAAGVARAIGARVAGSGGGALIIDYGHARSAAGETLQAVKGHGYHPVLADPGEADLTAHVDFQALAAAVSEAGVSCHGPVDQGEFLERLGIGARAGALAANATEGQAADIESAYRRLVDGDQMGTLFKVLAITGEGGPPPGFD
jgi:NADH dehydrogenase [ubiquinone] 1 alpha subcomplex assembly factor 7